MYINYTSDKCITHWLVELTSAIWIWITRFDNLMKFGENFSLFETHEWSIRSWESYKSSYNHSLEFFKYPIYQSNLPLFIFARNRSNTYFTSIFSVKLIQHIHSEVFLFAFYHLFWRHSWEYIMSLVFRIFSTYYDKRFKYSVTYVWSYC